MTIASVDRQHAWAVEDVGDVMLHGGQRRPGRGRHGHLGARQLERVAEQLARVLLVVDDEHVDAVE